MPHSWSHFEEQNPDLAGRARQRIHDRICYLATVRRDGSPRVFPVGGCIGAGSLWLFVGEDSPNRFDLRNDGRFALHCEVEDSHGGGGEVHVSGVAQEVTEPERTALAEESWPSRNPSPNWYLFELLPETVSYRTYSDGSAESERWVAD